MAVVLLVTHEPICAMVLKNRNMRKVLASTFGRLFAVLAVVPQSKGWKYVRKQINLRTLGRPVSCLQATDFVCIGHRQF